MVTAKTNLGQSEYEESLVLEQETLAYLEINVLEELLGDDLEPCLRI